MSRIEMVKQLIDGAQQRQATEEAGSRASAHWGQVVVALQQRLLALEVGYAGGCPHSIIREQV
jgi:hypothetical protein